MNFIFGKSGCQNSSLLNIEHFNRRSLNQLIVVVSRIVINVLDCINCIFVLKARVPITWPIVIAWLEPDWIRTVFDLIDLSQRAQTLFASHDISPLSWERVAKPGLMKMETSLYLILGTTISSWNKAFPLEKIFLTGWWSCRVRTLIVHNFLAFIFFFSAFVLHWLCL